MTQEGIVIAVILICASISVISSIFVVSELQKRGVDANHFYLRWMLFSYLKQYKELTVKESGRVGSLFYIYIVSINAALVVAILAAISGVFK